jgi:prefoldin subunit 5
MSNFHDYDPWEAMVSMNKSINTLAQAHNNSQQMIDLLTQQIKIQQQQLIDLHRAVANLHINKSTQ